MATKLISLLAAVLAAGALAACGSSSSSSSSSSAGSSSSGPSSSATTTTARASPAKLRSVPVHGPTVTRHLGGTSGQRVTIASVKHFGTSIHKGQHAHINGFAGLSLTQKLSASLGSVSSLWQIVFSHSHAQLPAASAVLVADTPTTCGSTQVTSASAPEYCPSTDTIMFPLGTVTANVAPLGDSALLLLVADLYGYHVENALGAFSKKYTGAQLEKMDSCFSGFYFSYAQAKGYLQPSDEQGINKLLALEAPAAGTSTSPGTVTAGDLAAAFNKGLLSNFKPSVCLPSSAG
ncbi:MAG: neutral zinc metallopeptidase [Solirubrobacteraceae bacterium]